MNKKKKFQSNRKYFTICIYGIVTFCICLGIFKLTNNWQDTTSRLGDILSMLSPFLIAFLIAYFVNPIIRGINRLLFHKVNGGKYEKLQKITSLVIAYMIVVGFIVLLLNFIIPQVISSISELVKQSPAMIASIENLLGNLSEDFPNTNFDVIEDFINDSLPSFLDYFKTAMGNIVPWLYSAGISIISWLINIILAFVISCYLMWDKNNLLNSMKQIVRAFFSKDIAEKIIVTAKECNNIFSSFIIGKAIDSLIIGILCFILMTILRLPYGALISLFIGVTNMIPYFGPFIGAVPGALILLIINPSQALIFIIMIFLLQQFDGTILGPKILGDSTGLQPIWIIFAITVGGYTAGVLGMFLGVPIVAVIAHLLNKLINYMIKKREESDNQSEGDNRPDKAAPEKDNPTFIAGDIQDKI